MGKYTEITIDEVLARTKLQLRIADTTEHDSYLQMMILEATRHLGALSGFTKKQCEISIIDRKSQLPRDFYKLIGVRIGCPTAPCTCDTAPCSCQNPFINNTCGYQLYVDTKFLNECGCGTNNGWLSCNSGFQINGGHIIWNSHIDQSGATLSYLSMNTDENGRLLIYEDYERALSNYACYQFTLSYPELYSPALSDRYNRAWVAQKGWVRGNDAANDFQNNKALMMSYMTSLIVSPIVNY